MAKSKGKDTKAPAPVRADGSGFRRSIDLVGKQPGPDNTLASVDMETRAGKRMFINAQSMPTYRPENLKDKVFRLEHWFAEPRSFHDKETSEDRDGVSITLIDPDGKSIRFGSEAVARMLDVIRSQYGEGPFDPPLYLRIENVTTANGRRSYSVQEVDESKVKASEKTW